MIRLFRRELPPGLLDLVRERTNNLLQIIGSNQDVPESLKTAYRDSRIKAILRVETGDKCAYCESKISHVYFGDVEHILPKAVYPELTFEHENLTLVCAVCNNSKGAFCDPSAPLLNPYIDDPFEFIYAAGPLIFYRPGSARGYVTCQKLQLNRASLLERRHEYLEDLARHVDAAVAASGALRDALFAELSKRIGPEREYSFVGRSFAAARLEHVTAHPRRPTLALSRQGAEVSMLESAGQPAAAPGGAPSLGTAPRG
jgi:HNH endonuclease